MPTKKKISSETEDVEELLNEGTEETSPDESETTKETAQGEAKVEKIKVGEEELTPDELSNLVKKARTVEGIEKEQNIDISQLYPDYTRKSQLLSDPVKLGGYIAEKFGTQNIPSSDDKLREQAVKEAREVYGIVTKPDLEEFKKSFKEELEVDRLLNDATDIEKESGIPKADLLDYMKVTKTTDPYEAAEKIGEYRKIHAGEQKTVTKPTFAEKSGSSGTHVPPGKKLPSMEDTEGIRAAITDMLQTPTVEEAE
jgi:hypothetical protein